MSFSTRPSSLELLVLAGSSAVTRPTKAALLPRRTQEPEALVETERLSLSALTRTQDIYEGIVAFIEKRQPNWNHSRAQRTEGEGTWTTQC